MIKYGNFFTDLCHFFQVVKCFIQRYCQIRFIMFLVLEEHLLIFVYNVTQKYAELLLRIIIHMYLTLCFCPACDQLPSYASGKHELLNLPAVISTSLKKPDIIS